MQRLEQKAALDSARSLEWGGHLSEAEAEYRRLAEDGDLRATFALHLNLRNREEAHDQALYWLKIAAKQIDFITPGLLPGSMSDALQSDSSLDLNAPPWSEDEPESDLDSLGDAYWDLGTTFIDAGRKVDGERLIEEAAEMGYSPAGHHWGLILLNRGETLEAEQWIRRAAEDGWAKAVEWLAANSRPREDVLSSPASMRVEMLRALSRSQAGSDSSSSQRDDDEREGKAGLETDVPDLGEVLAELEGLIGLEPVKEAVRSYANVVRNQQQRRTLGLKASSRSNHLVFVGPPGTGKTTVARLLGRIFRALGVLEHGEVNEVTRADLVAEYVGQTAGKTNEAIDRALGGVLFIDEAYTLVQDSDYRDAFGAEAIDTLMKRMEDDRDKFVLIAAGYQGPMQRFLDANPGLRSRFDETIDFPDYEPSDLLRVLGRFAASEDYELTPEAEATAASVFEQAWRTRGENFGNARLVRNLFEDATRAQANRLNGHTAPDTATLRRLEAADIPETA